MTGQPKKGTLRLDGANPMVFTEDEHAAVQWTPEQNALAKAVSGCIRAYLRATESLGGGKYAHLKEKLPAYLIEPGNVLIAVCPDGVVVRYERRSDEPRRIGTAIFPQGLATGAAVLSQNLVHVASPDIPLPEPQTFGVELTLSIWSPQPSQSRDVVSSRIWFHVPLASSREPVLPGEKPYCLLSVRNQLNLELHGTLHGEEEGSAPEQPFIARSSLRLAAGWDCIEVFPGVDVGPWLADYATLWAERDLLGALLIAHTADAQLSTLDPRASTRRSYAALLAEFKALLDSNPEREQVLQAFLEKHPVLLCPTHVRIWPKLPLGASVTDFVFRDAVHEYLLVELERSTLSLFRKDGHPTADLTHAHGQIVDWKRYIADNLSTVQRELGLAEISTNPSGLLVIGRSGSLAPENRRKLQAMMNESPKLRIMTYDDLYENARAVLENLLGPFWDTGGNTEILYPRAPEVPGM